MKTWLLFVFVCSAAFTALGVEPQSRVKGDAIYLYCSASTQDTREGIERFEDAENDNDPLFAHRPISFEMKSKQKKHLHTLFPLQFQSGGTQQNPPGRPRKRSDGNRHGTPNHVAVYQYVQSDHTGKQTGFLQNERRIMGMGRLAQSNR